MLKTLWPFFPGIIAAFGYAVKPAQVANAKLVLMPIYELENIFLFSELNSIVFFKSSFSTRSFFISRSSS